MMDRFIGTMVTATVLTRLLVLLMVVAFVILVALSVGGHVITVGERLHKVLANF